MTTNERMDKAERVATEIRQLCNFPYQVAANDVPILAAILRREYGDVRREALEEAARICEQHALNWERGRMSAASMDHVAQARMDAAGIRAAKEET